MKKKLIFKMPSTMKKVQVPTEDTPPKKKVLILKKVNIPTEEDEIAKLEAKIRENNSKLIAAGKVKTEKLPPKPSKRKAAKRELTSAPIMFSRWSPIVKRWATDLNLEVEYDEEVDVNRLDVRGEGFRIVVMAVIGGEFTVTLFFSYTEGFNTKKINIEYINVTMLEAALQCCIDVKDIFEEGETNGNN